METWYKTERHSWKIYEVKVEKHTENSIWINGRRNKIGTCWDKHHPSLEQAKTELRYRCKRNIETLEKDLAEAREALNNDFNNIKMG